jgi:predicted ATPase with chaperone activity
VDIDAGAAPHHHSAGDALAEALETTRIHRVAGAAGDGTTLVTACPFRAPHHTILDVGLIGGGQGPLPDDVSRASHGISFVDTLPECTCHAFEILRQPLENGITALPFPGRLQAHSVTYVGRARSMNQHS